MRSLILCSAKTLPILPAIVATGMVAASTDADQQVLPKPADVPPVVGMATVAPPAAGDADHEWSINLQVPKVAWEVVGEKRPKLEWPRFEVEVRESSHSLSMGVHPATQLSDRAQNRLLDLKGRRLGRGEAQKLLAKSTPVLVSVSGSMPDPFYLQCTKPDTLVVVLGIPHSPAPDLLPKPKMTNRAAESGGTGEKPSITVLADGFPAGNATPEGVACDLARAFIKRDPALFRRTCIAPFGGGENRKVYEEFLKNVVTSMEKEAGKSTPSPGGPKKITKLHAARHLSRNGPASTGYALHGFQDIMFVDVEVELVSGRTFPNRTMVIRRKDGTWRVHPAPQTASLLSMGLNDEAPSTTEFTDAYTVKQPGDE